MVELSQPLLALNLMAMIVCMSTLFAFGTESKEVVKAWLVEQYFALAAFSVVVLVVERLAMALLLYVNKLSELKETARDVVFKFLGEAVGKGYVFSLNDFACGGPADMEAIKKIRESLRAASACIPDDCRAAPSSANEIVPVSNESSQSCTPAFEESPSKDTPSAYSDDACSAATTM